MKRLFLMLMATFMVAGLYAQGLKIGDKAPDFRLKNVDGKMVSLADYTQAKGFIVIFSCNHCPFVKAYEDRMIALHEKYAPKGFPVIAINSNDPEVVPEDSFDKMVERAQQKKFPFVYLFDEGQKVYPLYGAARTPHVYILSKKANDLVVEYIGTIDDNYKDASAVKEKYVENAVDALLSGKKPAVTETKAVGCSIKVKK
ncbi:thioredoxin family protein [Tenuifilum osseticum]|uniref:thioredoxin family protein n=1 Tax=Tenuifilum osseticum TaxID=3374723 RepID=UPI0034E42F86